MACGSAQRLPFFFQNTTKSNIKRPSTSDSSIQFNLIIIICFWLAPNISRKKFFFQNLVKKSLRTSIDLTPLGGRVWKRTMITPILQTWVGTKNLSLGAKWPNARTNFIQILFFILFWGWQKVVTRHAGWTVFSDSPVPKRTLQVMFLILPEMYVLYIHARRLLSWGQIRSTYIFT